MTDPPSAVFPRWGIRQIAAGAALVAVDVLFVWKYGARLPVPLAAVMVAHLAGVAAAAGVGMRVRLWPAYAAVLSAGVLLGAAALVAVDTETLRVDRWFMIDTFWTNAVAGVYPYTPRAQPGVGLGVNTPGPFPIYYVLLSPFWAVSEIGLATLAAFVGLGVGLWRWLPAGRAGAAAAALAVSAPFLYEVATRSTVFANGALAVGVLYVLHRRPPETTQGIVAAGVLAGLLLSTRSVMAIPLAASAASLFLRDRRWGAFLSAGAVAGVTTALTLLPVYLWSPAAFAAHNPVQVQSTLSSPVVALGAVALAVALGVRSRTFPDVLTAAGTPLLGIAAVELAVNAVQAGWETAFFGSNFDLAYLVFALPFLLPVAAAPVAAASGPPRIVPSSPVLA